MTQSDVLQAIDTLASAGIEVWIDGGWGVDALLGEQTRHHDDLDLALRLSDVERALDVLAEIHYGVFYDELPTRIDLRSDDDRRVDLHPLTFDADGNGLQRLQDGSFGTYDAQALRGTGLIGGRRVSCLTPQTQMRFHRGYQPDDTDRHDVRLLAEHFQLKLPPEYLTTDRESNT